MCLIIDENPTPMQIATYGHMLAFGKTISIVNNKFIQRFRSNEFDIQRLTRFGLLVDVKNKYQVVPTHKTVPTKVSSSMKLINVVTIAELGYHFKELELKPDGHFNIDSMIRYKGDEPILSINIPVLIHPRWIQMVGCGEAVAERFIFPKVEIVKDIIIIFKEINDGIYATEARDAIAAYHAVYKRYVNKLKRRKKRRAKK